MITKGYLIKQVRDELGLTQKEFAVKLKLKRLGTISEYERNKHIPFERFTQIFTVYLRECRQDEQTDNIFSNYLDIYFKE